MTSLTELPHNLPEPTDDGGCDHLQGIRLPSVKLPSTIGRMVDLSTVQGLAIVYFYPMTGRPGVPLPDGWDAIPGARGCTPQACGFRDNASDLSRLGATVFGVSTQSSAEQIEAATRLHLPFELLSDHEMALTSALQLPTFEVDGRRLVKRLTLVLSGGLISRVFYPVFPPDKHAATVLSWLAAQAMVPGASSGTKPDHA